MRYEFLGEKDGASCLEFRVQEDCSALDLALATGMSRRSASGAFQRGELSRGGEALAQSSRLSSGDVVTVALAHPVAVHMPPSVPAVTIVYQDSVCLAADKPAGILVHGDGTGAATLTDRVRGALARQGTLACPQAVQRLDVDTTGLVLFSLSEEFQPAFDALVAGHAMHKRYLAEVAGNFPQDVTTIKTPIGRDRHDARRMRACRPGQGQPALTRVRVLGRRAGRSLLLVELGTGRRHQIRVHLSSMGFPIAGDELYGGRRDSRGLMLHALEEEFDHPVTGAHVLLRTEIPERLNSWNCTVLGT